MSLPTLIRELLENGVHFGHLRKHWNPKMEKFIYGRKKNIYIIDLEKTAQRLQEAQEFVKNVVKDRGKILFVSTKRQTRNIVKEMALSCGMPYMVERWIGGLLTNFSTVKSRVKEYKRLIEKRDKGEFEGLTKKEVVKLNKALEKMRINYEGIVDLEELPACLYIVDPKKEINAVKEAQKLNIPIVALIDTDGDPMVIDYPIPGNDDAIKSVKYITSKIVEAICEAVKEIPKIEEEKKSEEGEELESNKDEMEINKDENIFEAQEEDKYEEEFGESIKERLGKRREE